MFGILNSIFDKNITFSTKIITVVTDGSIFYEKIFTVK